MAGTGCCLSLYGVFTFQLNQPVVTLNRSMVCAVHVHTNMQTAFACAHL